MYWISIALITFIGSVISVAAQTPAQNAQTYNNQGNHLVEKGDSGAAGALYRDAIAIWRSLGPEFEPHLAGSLLNLGVALSGDGKRAEAAKAYEEALVLHRRSLGDKHHRTVSNMNLLASTYLMLGSPERGDALLQEALLIERELFPDDIQKARTLEGISNSLIRAGRPGESLAPAEEALAIAIKAAGEESMDAALAYATVAEAHRAARNPDRALPLFRKSRALYAKSLGPEHPRVASLLSQEGLILMDDGKTSLAEQLMVNAVQLLNKSCPTCVVELSVAQNNLGILRLKQKRYREADEALTASVALREKFEARPGQQLVESLRLLAFAREKQRLFADAVRLTTRANSIVSYR
jgi:tetratricopeptide (TPR) repeat protein